MMKKETKLQAPVLSDKYSVDVLWNEAEITTVESRSCFR